MALDRKRLDRAAAEAQRFLERVEEVRRKLNEDSNVAYNGSRETAAMRRASLDLSNALADLRRP